MKRVRVWTAAATLAALIGLIYAANSSSAGEENKALKASVMKVAGAIKAGDMALAKKLATPIGKKAESMEDVMGLFGPKKSGGFGFGPGPTDGIDRKLREVMRDGAKAKDAPLFEDAAYKIAAVGLIAEGHTGNVKENAKKKRKDWERWSEDMVKGSFGLAKAAKTKSPAEIKTAVSKLYNNCTTCHGTFKE